MALSFLPGYLYGKSVGFERGIDSTLISQLNEQME